MPLSINEWFDFSPLPHRSDFEWPDGKRLAVYFALNIEDFNIGDGSGVDLDRPGPPPNLRSVFWREYGNRVGVWRIIDLFNEQGLPLAVVANSVIYDRCAEIMDAFRARGDEVIAHGTTNSIVLNKLTEEEEIEQIQTSVETIERAEGRKPAGWLSPYLAPSERTPRLLKSFGFEYTLDWVCDDQPFWGKTDSGPLLSIPYPVELNDQPSVVFRRDSAERFADMIIDGFEEQLEYSRKYPLVFAASLHTFIMGQPFRVRHLRRALQHIASKRDEIWITTPKDIAAHFKSL
jgi:peptidoglycan/xylan/chitin deacetylase (PgdA/CDA1 family)